MSVISEVGLLPVAAALHLVTQVDSKLETTRVFWRTKFFKATPEEARDPRPWTEVLAAREGTARIGGVDA